MVRKFYEAGHYDFTPSNKQITECYFTPDKKTTSATICANCGKEKMLHTIGEGMKVKSIEIITHPQTKDRSIINQ